jgi:hypothetical protein
MAGGLGRLAADGSAALCLDIGSRTVAVPAAHGGRTTQFDFQYTFTAADGDTGKVTFKAFATILGARDALPADNAAIAAPTTVKA